VNDILTSSNIEENVTGFAESSKVLLKVLDEVAKVHPFVAVAGK
jgi:hypothetical protein